MSDYKEIIVKEFHNEKGLLTRREIGEELIRCKDCKYYQGMVFKNGICKLNSISMDEDDYCSYGERKED